jgi:hypothetical protein
MITKTHEIGFAQLTVHPIPNAFGTKKLESSLLK